MAQEDAVDLEDVVDSGADVEVVDGVVEEASKDGFDVMRFLDIWGMRLSCDWLRLVC